MKGRYRHIKLKEQIRIDKIYSFHYSELRKDYIYDGERHNFWEFLYVDKGEVEITTDFQTFLLGQGDIVFYSPNEFHSLRCNRKVPPNIFIVSFDSKSESMRFFSRKSLRLGDGERQLLTSLIEEGNKLFALPVDRLRRTAAARSAPKHPLTRKDKPEFGSEQLIKIYLEALLIRLIRSNRERKALPRLSTVTNQKSRRDITGRITEYMDAHLLEDVSLDRLCAEFAMSKTHMRAMFREQLGCGITEYVGHLKIERAKRYIREDTCNITEIAERLGYSSIHYFSRHFKKATGMSPSEYLKSMKAYL